MRDYTYFYREELSISSVSSEKWDIFISGFNNSYRVKNVFGAVVASKKHWIIHKEYSFDSTELPSEDKFVSSQDDEADFIIEYVDTMLHGVDLASQRICVDITGFMRPHMMFLVRFLWHKGVRKLDVLYSEPKAYINRERTVFSDDAVAQVRQVSGFEGVNNNDTSKDLLIIGAGYESHLIAEVAEEKEKAERVIILGLPSLSADMYQQNALRTHAAADAIGESSANKHFAPANDPFVTATVLSEIVGRRNATTAITNLYLSPLATKAQALGFVIFYIWEREGQSTSILFPYSSKYHSDTSDGVLRVWKYTVEFPPV